MTLFLPPLNLNHVARTTVVGLIQETLTDSKLLDQIARIYCKDTALIKDLIEHPRVMQMTLVFLCESGSPEVQMALKCRLAQLSTSADLRVPRSSPDSGATRPVSHPEADTDQNIYQKILQMTVAKKVQFAMKADKTARSLLIKDPNKLVALAVVESPKITEQEIESIAQSRNVSEDVLRAISKKREWLKKYTIVHALVSNPKTPVGIAVTLLPSLRTNDLNLLLKNKAVSEAVRTLASKIHKVRSKT